MKKVPFKIWNQISIKRHLMKEVSFKITADGVHLQIPCKAIFKIIKI